MPQKAKFSKEEIIEAAIGIVRANGMQGLTARALGSALGTSARPIFTAFRNMEEVSACVIEAADGIYRRFLEEAIRGSELPPYKASGMGYIRFAREERALFQLLFMRDRSHEEIREDRAQIKQLLEIIQKNMNISEDEAYFFHLEMWLYVHGIATMIATSYLDPDDAFIDTVLTDAFQGQRARIMEKKQAEAQDEAHSCKSGGSI